MIIGDRSQGELMSAPPVYRCAIIPGRSCRAYDRHQRDADSRQRKSVSKTINNLYRLGRWCTAWRRRRRTSPHAAQEELLMLNPRGQLFHSGARRVSYARDACGLARKTGVEPQTAYRIENGDVIQFTPPEGKIGKTYGGNVMVMYRRGRYRRSGIARS